MNITCITVCVNYSDYLKTSIEWNRHHFDRWIVVTDNQDDKTVNLCRDSQIECLQTNAFYKDGSPFNKSAAINLAIEYANPSDWILLLDADIVLPRLTRHILEHTHLNEQFIYGIDRVLALPELWKNYVSGVQPDIENEFWQHPIGIPETRIIMLDQGGYIPLGFFQLCNVNAHALRMHEFYDENYKDASGCDIQFVLKWNRTHRHFLPELTAIHLSTNNVMGINWKGRKSIEFKT